MVAVQTLSGAPPDPRPALATGPRIAVLHASAGNGHQSAARALAAAMAEQWRARRAQPESEREASSAARQQYHAATDR